MIHVGAMVADLLYFNQVERARHWYIQSNMTTVVEVRYVLLTGFQLQANQQDKQAANDM